MWQHVQQTIGSISITREDMTTKDPYAYQVEPLRKSGVSPHLRWYLRFPSLPSNFITLDLLPRGATCWKTVVLSWGSALCEVLFISLLYYPYFVFNEVYLFLSCSTRTTPTWLLLPLWISFALKVLSLSKICLIPRGLDSLPKAVVSPALFPKIFPC